MSLAIGQALSQNRYTCMYRVGQSIVDLNVFFKYRSSCHIEAYVRPEKYWLVWAGSLANHLLNFNLIFLSDGLTVMVNEWHVLQISTAASRSHSAAIDGCRAARF